MADRLDLNTARLREIAELPGVDRWLARRIVLDRRIHGPFQGLEDLARVEGVTPRVLDMLAARVDIMESREPLPAHLLMFGQVGEGAEPAGPLLFVGPPNALRGSFILRNHGESSVRAPRFRIENTTLRGFGNTLRPTITVDVWLPPGAEQRVTLAVSVDPFTAPGTYEAELVHGETRQPVKFIVTGSPLTVLSPSRLLLTQRHRRTEHQVLVRNDGNVPLTIEDLGALVLEDMELQCRVIRETVRHTQHPTWDELVGTAADELKKEFGDLKPLEVRTLNKPVHVPPGGQALLVLEVEIPKEIPRRRTYVATGRVGDASLAFELSWSLRH
jgi:hypothetical protein